MTTKVGLRTGAIFRYMIKLMTNAAAKVVAAVKAIDGLLVLASPLAAVASGLIAKEVVNAPRIR